MKSEMYNKVQLEYSTLSDPPDSQLYVIFFILICFLIHLICIFLSHHVEYKNANAHLRISAYVQCYLLILPPLVNMSKGSCENKFALFHLSFKNN